MTKRISIAVNLQKVFSLPYIRPTNWHECPGISFRFRWVRPLTFPSNRIWLQHRMVCVNIRHRNVDAFLRLNVSFDFSNHTANEIVNWNAWPITQKQYATVFSFGCRVRSVWNCWAVGCRDRFLIACFRKQQHKNVFIDAIQVLYWGEKDFFEKSQCGALPLFTRLRRHQLRYWMVTSTIGQFWWEKW